MGKNELKPFWEESEISTGRFDEIARTSESATWLQNVRSESTRKAYQKDIQNFIGLVGIRKETDFVRVERSHIVAWRRAMENSKLSGPTIRRRLAALSSLFEHLCEAGIAQINPVRGVKRPSVESSEGKTPALSDRQARMLLDAPSIENSDPKSLRDRAILAVLLFQGLRRAELCSLNAEDYTERRGIRHLRIHGKGGKIRFLPCSPEVVTRLEEYLFVRKTPSALEPLFVRIRKGGIWTEARLTPDGIYGLVLFWARKVGINIRGFSPHSLRATVATNALEHDSDIARVQEFLGHANIATTRIYDRRNFRPEKSPAFAVSY